MIRLIAVITMILMPVISVSTGTTEQQSIVRSLDIIDQQGHTKCEPNCSEQTFGGVVAFGNGSR